MRPPMLLGGHVFGVGDDGREAGGVRGAEEVLTIAHVGDGGLGREDGPRGGLQGWLVEGWWLVGGWLVEGWWLVGWLVEGGVLERWLFEGGTWADHKRMVGCPRRVGQMRARRCRRGHGHGRRWRR